MTPQEIAKYYISPLDPNLFPAEEITKKEIVDHTNALARSIEENYQSNAARALTDLRNSLIHQSVLFTDAGKTIFHREVKRIFGLDLK